MPRPKGIPAYKLHKASGQARVIIDGRHVYLGPYGSQESHEEYGQVIAEYLQRNPVRVHTTNSSGCPTDILSVNELILAYVTFAKSYYIENGEPTKEVASIKDALKPLRELYGRSNASEFGPKSLAIVRQHMISSKKLCRNEINKRIGRIKRMFKWGTSEELIEPSVFHALQTLSGLRYGRSDARETEPVKPVSENDVEAILQFLSPPIRAMVEVQRLTAMRPGEVVSMRLVDIDRTSELWEFRPHNHKNRWRGHDRMVPLGPRTQLILRPFLDRAPDAYLFSPADAVAWRIEQQAKNSGKGRKTRIYQCEIRRLEAQRLARKKRRRRRLLRDHYDTSSYHRSIQYAIRRARKAGIEVADWHPNQLRHSKATELRKQFGLEAAQVVLGHVKADVTQIYAERNIELAREIARSSG